MSAETLKKQADELIQQLHSLVRINIDSIQAYRQIVSQMETHDIRDHLFGFQKDHERHAEELSQVVRELGGEPPQVDLEFRGFSRNDFRLPEIADGLEAALRALKANERVIQKSYRQAMAWSLPPHVYDLIRRQRDEEQRHLSHLERAIASRLWEKKVA